MGIPQSALAFIFIGRGSRTPLQVDLYKNFQNKTKSTRITTGQTSLTGRPDRSDRSASELPETAVNTEVAQDLAKEFRQEMGPRRRRRPCRQDHRVPIGSCLLSTWTHQGGRTHGAACWAHRIVARARENCKNKTQNNAPRKFAIPNITFVKTGLQTLGT